MIEWIVNGSRWVFYKLLLQEIGEKEPISWYKYPSGGANSKKNIF